MVPGNQQGVGGAPGPQVGGCGQEAQASPWALRTQRGGTDLEDLRPEGTCLPRGAGTERAEGHGQLGTAGGGECRKLGTPTPPPTPGQALSWLQREQGGVAWKSRAVQCGHQCKHFSQTSKQAAQLSPGTRPDLSCALPSVGGPPPEAALGYQQRSLGSQSVPAPPPGLDPGTHLAGTEAPNRHMGLHLLLSASPRLVSRWPLPKQCPQAGGPRWTLAWIRCEPRGTQR